MASKILPKALVFDLDGCIWSPEMYELWGRGGSPFTLRKDGDLTDRGGNHVELLADVRPIMHDLKTNPKWSNTVVGIASRCDEPGWAAECIRKFGIGDGWSLKDVFSPNHTEIYKGSKVIHMKAIEKKMKGASLQDMIFFDNEYGNCQTVAGIGVTVVYTPDGVTKELFNEAIEKFPAPGQVLGPKKRGYW